MKQFFSRAMFVASSIFLLQSQYDVLAQTHQHSSSTTPKDFKGIQFHNLLKDNEMVTIQNMPDDKPVLLFFFRTDCGHCRADAPKIPNLAAKYKIPFWMASHQKPVELKQFASEFKLGAVPNLLFLYDFSKEMHDWFEYRYVPFIALIDKKGNLIKEFKDLPTPEDLEEVIRTYNFMEGYSK